MFILPDNWELASLLAKLLLYFGAFSVAGGSLCAWRYANGSRAALFSNFSYVFLGTVVGFHGVILGFLVQVGLINDSGIAGMLDWGMASILLDTSQGDVALLRMAAFILAGICSVVLLRRLQYSNLNPGNALTRLLYLLLVVAVIAIAYSQTLLGHVSVLSPIAKVSIVLHFIAFALWIGCCYPFLQLSRVLEISTLQQSLRQFGNHAIGILFVLAVAGVLMLWELLSTPLELIESEYGLAMLTKLALVLVILCVAATNKLILVPRLVSSGSAAKLQTSLRYEIVIAVLILLVTSYLSTIVGPAAHDM